MQLCSDQLPPIPRRTANYPPSLWDDCCIQSLSDGFLNAAQVDRWERLKEDVRHLIEDKKNDIVELLELIDAFCQIGISYHFESEIKNMLHYVGSSFGILSNILKDNLHGFALLFRLLREHGIDVPNLSVDVLLSSFKNESGLGFKNNILSDIKGMLSLYEASYLVVEGEDELDEAREFTSKHLTNYLKEPLFMNLQLHEEVDHAMELPLHWRIPRLHMKWFIDTYERQEKMNPKLLEFAKLDFNMVQSLHKKELKEMSRWWRNLGLDGDAFNFSRDRLMEIYLFSVECTYEPHFWRCRKMMTKISCIVSLIDDIYDIYGLLDELELFTEAVDEWKITTQLPNYMERTLAALFDTMNDIAHDISVEKDLDILPHLKRAWRDICKAYLVEARWFYAGYTPTLNEYFENAWITVTIPLLLTSAYCASEDLTKDALKSFVFYPDVARHSSMLTRLYDDLGTSTDELQRGDVPKSIQCHMNETNISESAARDHMKCLIKKHWKLMNGEHIAASSFQDSFKRYVLNLPRLTHVLYQCGDGYGKPGHETRDRIISLLIEPIPL